MNGAIQVKSADSVKWADGMAIVSLELHTIDNRCATFNFRLRAVVYPRTIVDNMNDGRIINKVDTTALADGDTWLCEIVI